MTIKTNNFDGPFPSIFTPKYFPTWCSCELESIVWDLCVVQKTNVSCHYSERANISMGILAVWTSSYMVDIAWLVVIMIMIVLPTMLYSSVRKMKSLSKKSIHPVKVWVSGIKAAAAAVAASKAYLRVFHVAQANWPISVSNISSSLWVLPLTLKDIIDPVSAPPATTNCVATGQNCAKN